MAIGALVVLHCKQKLPASCYCWRGKDWKQVEGAATAAEREDGDGGNEGGGADDEEKKHPTIVKTNGVDAKKETCTWSADEKKGEEGSAEEKEALQKE